MYTLISYMSSGSHSYCNCCQGESWDSNFYFEENLSIADMITGLSNRWLENHDKHASWAFVILKDGVRIYDSENYSGSLQFYSTDSCYIHPMDSEEHKQLESSHNATIEELNLIFKKAKERVDLVKIEKKRIEDAEKEELSKKTKARDLENKRKQLEQLKKDLGE